MAKKDYQRVVSHKSFLEHYVADAFILRCIDDRFWDAFLAFLEGTGMKFKDSQSPVGGIKKLASPAPGKELEREWLLDDIETCIKLHHCKKVILVAHTDCGAYGYLKAFGNDEEKEFAFMLGELKKAEEVIKARFPQLTIEKYFNDGEGFWKTQ